MCRPFLRRYSLQLRWVFVKRLALDLFDFFRGSAMLRWVLRKIVVREAAVDSITVL